VTLNTSLSWAVVYHSCNRTLLYQSAQDIWSA